MLPIHLLVQNLLYDMSQTAIPFDRMDDDYLSRPRRWDASDLSRFMIYTGPISSIFDITTYLLMWHVFGCSSPGAQSLFQSGWFVEGLLSQTLIVHMIRTKKIPFIQSRASWPVMCMTAGDNGGRNNNTLHTLRLVHRPYAPASVLLSLVGGNAHSYCVLTQVVKEWYIRRFKRWL